MLNNDLPLFVYGSLKQGELAHELVKPLLVAAPKSAWADGYELLVIDGVATAIRSNQNGICGELLEFKDPSAAYKKILDFEDVPDFYAIEETSVLGGPANILVSNNPTLKSRHDKVDVWTSAHDGLLAFGIPWAHKRIEGLRDNLKDLTPNFDFWMAYHDLQSVFQILWSITERILLFHDGPKSRDMPLGEKISWLREMTKHGAILRAVEAVSIDPLMGVRSNRQPYASAPQRTGSTGFVAWYAMRNNVVHRGKSSRVEKGALWTATVDLHNTLAYYLQNNSIPIKELWENLTKQEANRYSDWLYKIQR